MRKALLGFVITAGAWAVFLAINIVIAVVRGQNPLEMLQWNVGVRYLLIVATLILALGTAIGYASDRIRQKG